MFTKGVGGHCLESRRHDATSPERGSKPVTDLGSDALDIAVTRVSNAANGPIVYRHSEPGARLHRDGDAQEGCGVSDCERMRKRIAHVQPYPPVVRMLRERYRIVQAPLAHRAFRQNDHSPNWRR